MSLAEEYRRQFAWRDWERVFAALPPLAGTRVLDLGCGAGDVAAALAARGARVLAVDANEELLAEARARDPAGVEFLRADLRALPAFAGSVDGVWCSFAAAYFPDLAAVLPAWTVGLRPGGWMAMVEIDDLFAHHPLSARVRDAFESYARDALAAGRYDFRMGRRLRGELERAGLAVRACWRLADHELAFAGPAGPDVVDAWRRRLERMTLFQAACGAAFPAIRDEFLACLTRADHGCAAQVYCCIAVK